MHTQEKEQVLKLLAKEWVFNGPPGIMDISDVVSALNMAPSETLETVKSLFETGLVDMNSLKTSVFLTPNGYDEAKKDTT